MTEQYNQKTQSIMCKAKKYGKTLEERILPLVNTMNSLNGIITNESCEGHPEKLEYPWIRFTLNEHEKGIDSVSIAALALATFGWMLLCEPSVNVNPANPVIPSVLKSKPVCYRFLAVPVKAAASERFLLTPYFKAVSEEAVIQEQSKIPAISQFIIQHTEKFCFSLEEPRKAI